MFEWVAGLDGTLQRIGAALQTLTSEWRRADHEVRISSGELLMDALRRTVPNYDFRRNFYYQFGEFALSQPVHNLEQAAGQFSEIAATARSANPALFIAIGSLGQLFSLYAVRGSARRKRTRKAASDLYAVYSYSLNDMIQYTLYYDTASLRHQLEKVTAARSTN